MIISLAGHQGAGKSTVGALLAQKLGYKRYSSGDFMRQIAKEKESCIQSVNKESEKDWGLMDQLVDERQKLIGATEDNFIIDGRLAFHFIPHSFKVFLAVDAQTGAERIFHDEQELRKQTDTPAHSVEETLQKVVERRASESKRYLQYYGIDNQDPAHYDLVIDTTHQTPEEVVEQILSAVAPF